MVAFATLPLTFQPANNSDFSQVTITLPPGSTLAQTQAAAEQARLMIAKVEHVKSVYTTIGGGSAGGGHAAGSRGGRPATRYPPADHTR